MRPTVQVDSKNYRLVQVADILAGLARFSYIVRNRLNPPMLGLDPSLDARSSKPSSTDEYRLPVLARFLADCRHRSLSVSNEPPLRGLATRDPSEPVNFWTYAALHPGDRGELLQKPKRVHAIPRR